MLIYDLVCGTLLGKCIFKNINKCLFLHSKFMHCILLGTQIIKVQLQNL